MLALALLAAGLTHSRGYLVDAPRQQYRELLTYWPARCWNCA
jgi:hypothetical protein